MTKLLQNTNSKPYLTYNGTMFGDLDCPLNASCGFVSISWASCFLFGLLWETKLTTCQFRVPVKNPYLIVDCVLPINLVDCLQGAAWQLCCACLVCCSLSFTLSPWVLVDFSPSLPLLYKFIPIPQNFPMLVLSMQSSLLSYHIGKMMLYRSASNLILPDSWQD